MEGKMKPLLTLVEHKRRREAARLSCECKTSRYRHSLRAAAGLPPGLRPYETPKRLIAYERNG